MAGDRDRTRDGGTGDDTMFEMVDELLGRALAAGADGAEVYAERGTSRRIKVYQHEVEQLSAAQKKGVGLRVVKDGAPGYAYSSETDAAALEELVGGALDNAAVTDADEHVVLPAAVAAYPELAVYDERLAAAGDDEKIELAMSVERAALEADPRVKLVEDTVYADGDAEVFLASSTGARGTFRENHCYTFAYALAEQDGQIETGLSFSVGRALGDLDPQACGSEAAERACRLLGAGSCATMKATVVLDPYVAASFLGVVSAALTADAVQKGRSLFADLVGEPVGAPLLELVDDGLHPDGLGSSPFDGEGVACRRTPLLSGGVLQGFLHNTYTAHKAGLESTGNASRGTYQAMPNVGPTNLVVGGQVTPVDEIVAGIERGVLVTNAVGVHSGANPVTGQFSVGISGLLIESGAVTRPVREVTLAGDIVGMLKGVVALGDDARWIPMGSILTPSLAIEGVTIGGD
jgi:PmbA protein